MLKQGYLLLAVSIFYSAGAAADLDKLCDGARPDDDSPAAQAEYDRSCEDYLARRTADEKAAAEKAKRDAEIAERKAQEDEKRKQKEADQKAELEMLDKISAKFKPAEPKAPDLAAFSSIGKRHIADLAFTVGKKLAPRLNTDGVIAGNKNKVLMLQDPATAYLWMDQIDTQPVIDQLGKVRDDAKKLTSTSCTIEKSLPVEALISPSVGTAVLALGTVIDAAKFVAQQFQPQILAAASVDAPSDLRGPIMAGMQADSKPDQFLSKVVFLSVPPPILKANPVQKSLAEASSALEAAAGHLAEMADNAKPKKLNAACAEKYSKELTRITGVLKGLTSKNADAGTDSPVAQASRQAAREEANIAYIMVPEVVTAGGAVTGYQRNRFSAVKLVTGSDVALVARWFKSNGEVRAYYVTLGCGRAIPLGEFTETYSDKTCDPQ